MTPHARVPLHCLQLLTSRLSPLPLRSKAVLPKYGVLRPPEALSTLEQRPYNNPIGFPVFLSLPDIKTDLTRRAPPHITSGSSAKITADIRAGWRLRVCLSTLLHRQILA